MSRSQPVEADQARTRREFDVVCVTDGRSVRVGGTHSADSPAAQAEVETRREAGQWATVRTVVLHVDEPAGQFVLGESGEPYSFAVVEREGEARLSILDADGEVVTSRGWGGDRERALVWAARQFAARRRLGPRGVRLAEPVAGLADIEA